MLVGGDFSHLNYLGDFTLGPKLLSDFTGLFTGPVGPIEIEVALIAIPDHPSCQGFSHLFSQLNEALENGGSSGNFFDMV